MFLTTVMVLTEFFKQATPSYELDTSGFSKLNPFNWFKEKTYGQELEEYIISNNPVDVTDVERLADQFDKIRSSKVV